MSSPEGEPLSPPEFFIDRSLGRSDVPTALREAGFVVETLWTRYGPGAEQFVEDIQWIRDAGERKEVVLSKDQGFKYVSIEREMIERFSVRVFRLANAQLKSHLQVAWYMENMQRILKHCQKPGPYIDVVHADRITRQWPLD